MIRGRSFISLVVAAVAVATLFAGQAFAAGEPTGLTALSQSGSVELAWQPVAGASSYQVYRGTSDTSITTQLVSSQAGTTYSNTGLSNGTTYYYAVRARIGTSTSGNSNIVSATPTSRSCSTGNAIHVENCYSGDSDWGVDPAEVQDGGIEGFATAQSINRGGSVQIKVNSQPGSTYDIDVFRTGYYGGDGARLVSRMEGLAGVAQPACSSNATTGLLSCANWSTSATVTTTANWTTGMYLLRLTRQDTGRSDHVLFTVRNDSSNSDVLYGGSYSTYQAYNPYGGKSLYDYNSTGADTVSGSRRAVAVSFDRPFEQSQIGDNARDWYTVVDQPHVAWLERQGYNVSYAANTDLETSPSLALGHQAYISPAHDEYYSAGMRGALEGARDAGVGLFFTGANEVYWKVRFTDSNRTMVSYKSSQSGGPDPSGTPTGTWRDPAGANKPENALSGGMYVGDNDYGFFPLRVSAAEGTDRVFRHTGLDTQAPGTFTNVGTSLVGWEWDSTVDNGFQPGGLTVLSSSPVDGELVQNNGGSYAPGTAVAHMSKYEAPSGALVFATGTNHWTRGLANNFSGTGEPNTKIQQITTNVMLDMGVIPETPQSGLVVDLGPTISTVTPIAGATGVAANVRPTARFSLTMNASTITNSTFTLTPAGGSAVLASVAYNATTRTATLTPSAQLIYNTVYTARVTTGVRSSGGAALSANYTWTFTTSAPPPPLTIASSNPAANAVNVASTISPRAIFSRALDPATVTTTSVSLLEGGLNPVAGAVTYDAATNRVTFAPTNPLGLSTGYSLRLAGTIAATDGTTLGTTVNIPFTTSSTAPPAPAVTSVAPDPSPQPGRDATPSAVFSLPIDSATLTPSTFTLTPAGGSPVAATVTYDANTRTATLHPTANLQGGVAYTARLTTGVKSDDGVALTGERTWTFTTAECPCSFFDDSVTPASQGNSTQDDRTGPGPFTYEMGVRFTVTDASQIDAVRFYKSTGENGTHIGRIWNAAGAQVAQVTFANETASGWQRQNLAAPLTLQAGQTYTVSVNTNTNYAFTPSGLANQIVAGPFRTIVGPNGVYGASAGTFPTSSFNSGNYFVDLSGSAISTAGQPPTVVDTSPANSAIGVAQDTDVTATFSRPLDPATVTGSGASVTPAGGSAVTAAVTYDDQTRSVRINPTANLAPNTTYTARLTTAIHAVDGTPLANAVTWQFTTESPAPSSTFQLFSNASVPVSPANPVQDGRPGPGPFTYEMGVKVTAITDGSIRGVRFYKSPGETGTHIGRIWTSGGTQIAQVTFAGEGASGWQTQQLSTPVPLVAGQTYVISVNRNAFYPLTTGGLAQEIVAGPIASVVGSNGLYNESAGNFPVGSWNNSNYYVDLLVVGPPDPPPSVTATTPANGAGNVAANSSVTATLSRALDPATVTSSSVTLTPQGGSPVAASVSYDDATHKITLQPTANLASATNYTARIGTAVTATDGTPLTSAATWQFSTSGPLAITVTSPLSGATGVSLDTDVTATFSRPIDPATMTAANYTLTAAGGAAVTAGVVYDDQSRTATLDPAGNLAPDTTYTARVSTAVTTDDGTPLANAVTWQFTTADALPVQTSQLFPNSLTPASPANPVQDGRPGAGPFTYEMGVKILAVSTGEIRGVRFYKSPGETGTHVGRVWSSGGTQLAQVTFAGESASGWQTQQLSTPLPITPGQTYIISVNRNAFYALTTGGLAQEILAGPIASVVGSNGVYNESAGNFPTGSWNNANYFADVVVAAVTPQGPAPQVSSTTPASDASGVSMNTNTTATFSRELDPATITASSFTLTPEDGAPVPATVSYDAPSGTATLNPTTDLDPYTTYTARLTTAVGASDGAHLAAATTWQFTTEGAAPAQTSQLFPDTATPASPANAVRDGRPGVGPWTYEMGVKVTATADGEIRAVRYFKSEGETGTHIGRIWTSGGTQLAQVTFAGESASGWQTQQLVQPLAITAGQTYVVSVNRNDFYPYTPQGLVSQVVAGPVSTVVGGNGVFADAAGSFPTGSFGDSDYLVDLVVAEPTVAPPPPVPVVSTTSPADAATAVPVAVSPTATFSRSMSPASLTGTSVTLRPQGGSPVAATVTYDAATRRVTINPTADLATNQSYTAEVSTAATSAAGAPLGAAVSWSFTTAGPPPTVTATTPADNATETAVGVSPTATFSRGMDPATLTSATATVRPQGGSAVAASVTYDAANNRVTIDPTTNLTPGTVYTAQISAAANADDGVGINAATSWTFTTVAAPTVTATTPADNATETAVGVSPTATFSRAMDPATLTSATATVRPQGGSAVAASVTYDAANNRVTIDPTTNLTPGTVYTAQIGTAVTAGDDAPLASAFTWSFTTVAAPTATATTPADNATGVALGVSPTATFSRAMDPATITSATATVRPAGGSAVAASVTYDAANNRVTIDPTADLNPGTTYTAQITTAVTAADAAPLGAAVTWTFTTLTSPTVSATTPADNATGVAITVSPTATFSRAMSAATITSASATVRPTGGSAVAATVTYDAVNNRVTIDPTANLTPNTVYTAQVSAAATSADGVPLAGAVSWSFTTIPAPTVTATVPAAAATGVAPAASLTATFSRAMNPATLTTASASVRPQSSGTALAAAVTYDAASSTVTINPNATLNLNTVYVATITAAATASDGIALAAPVTWTFTTAAAPTVTATSPANNATGFAPNGTITATFSRAMNPATLTTSSAIVRRQSGGGNLTATVTYDAANNRVSIDPTTALLPNTGYTAQITTAATSADGVALGSTVSWNFTTAAAPTVTATTPTNNSLAVAADISPTATFSRAMDAATLTTSSATVRVQGSGSALAAAVTYDSATNRVTIDPTANLAAGTAYTAQISTSATSADGAPLSSTVSWSFTTPAQLFADTLVPTTPATATTTIKETGVRLTVTDASQVRAIRFYKSPGETGTHTGRIWNIIGQQVGSVTFTGETASGWQTAQLASPVSLTNGLTYTISVNRNNFYPSTANGLNSQVTAGPVRTVVGTNGVYATTAGTRPTTANGNNNYFVDLIVTPTL